MSNYNGGSLTVQHRINWETIRKFIKYDYLMLLPILALAFYLNFIPHLNYHYPIHLDEWNQLAYSNEIISKASITDIVEPFSGNPANLFQRVEVGSHLIWAVFHQISGISWMTIYTYAPSVIFVFLVLSVFVLTRKFGFGLEAALFACFIPTFVGILGPRFLVPVALALPLIPIWLFIAFNFHTLWSYLTLLIIFLLLLLIHSATAVALLIIIAPYILINLRSDFKHSLGIILALGLPFAAALPLIFNQILPILKNLSAPKSAPTYADIPNIVVSYGYLPVLVCLAGVFVLSLRREKAAFGLVLGLLAILLMLVAFYTFHYGIEDILYLRGLLIAMLIMSIVAGAGLAGVKNIRLPATVNDRLRVPLVTQNLGKILYVVFICLVLIVAIPARRSTPYYHMIESEDYIAFTWIRDNVGTEYSRAILDPWKGSAFTAITGKRVYTLISVQPMPIDQKAYQFLSNSSNDTAFLKKNGISIVYSLEEVNNPDLSQVTKNVWLLKGSGSVK
jgi:hypothetical protein